MSHWQLDIANDYLATAYAVILWLSINITSMSIATESSAIDPDKEKKGTEPTQEQNGEVI